MNNEIRKLSNSDFEVLSLSNIPLPTNASEFERLKPVNTYKKIVSMENQLETIKNMVTELQNQLNSLKDSFLKGE